MKHILIAVYSLTLSISIHAAPIQADAGLAEVKSFGRLNGQALACSYGETAARIKRLIIERAPKSRRYGDAFETATSDAYREAVAKGRDTCPAAAALERQVEELAASLRNEVLPELSQQDAVPPEWSHPADPEQPEIGIVARYLLMDSNGRAVTQEDFPGRFQLIAFGYTFCPDICPTTLAEMSLILNKLGKQADRLQPIFITVDPERDTPDKLRKYGAFFNSRIIGLTGSPELVRRAADNFRVRYEKHLEPGADPDKYTVDHSAGMYLVGPDGRYLGKFAYGTAPGEAAERIRLLMDKTPARASHAVPQSIPKE